jgi:signal transduction histidine kinase
LDDEIRTTIRLFDSLLSIAQMDAEAGNTSGLVQIDLSQIAKSISDLYEAVAEEEGREIVTDLADNATILGDAQLFAQLLSNLIENGLKYTNAGDKITLRVWRDGPRVRLLVQDNGPGIPAGQRAQLFTAFSRGKDTQGKPGHGLGLSLVRAIALRHGAIPSILPVEKGFAIEINCLHFSGN